MRTIITILLTLMITIGCATTSEVQLPASSKEGFCGFLHSTLAEQNAALGQEEARAVYILESCNVLELQRIGYGTVLVKTFVKQRLATESLAIFFFEGVGDEWHLIGYSVLVDTVPAQAAKPSMQGKIYEINN